MRKELEGRGSRPRAAALIAALALAAGCGRTPPGNDGTKSDDSSGMPALALRLAALAANDAPLPRELAELPLGLGLTLPEAKLRVPDLMPDPAREFAAVPTYFICDEIALTHLFLLAQTVNLAAFQSRPRAAGVQALEVYAVNGQVEALRELYEEETARRMSYGEFIARGAKRYGRPVRSESLGYSDGTTVRYTLWRTRDTAILLGETNVPRGPFLSRYVYMIDGALLAQALRGGEGRTPGQLGKVAF